MNNKVTNILGVETLEVGEGCELFVVSGYNLDQNL